VEQHGVARPDGESGRLKAGPGIGDGDDLTWLEHGGPTVCRHVDEQPTGDHLGQRVDAEPAGAVVLGDVGEPVPVVGPIAHLQVVQPVQVGAHLLGRGDLLDDPVDGVASEPVRAAALGPPVDVVVVGRQVLPEAAARERRHVGVQHVREVVHDTAPDQRRRLDDLRGGDLVERAGLVVRSVPRRPPALRDRSPWCQRGVGHCAHSLDQVLSKDG
jgi:hypothetical protein